jgi:hypothetical protein
MLEQILLITGAAIFGTLGTIHLVYTFFSDKFDPRDAAVRDAMQVTTMRITRATSLWNAWIGFNASHSLGAMVFGLFMLLLATLHMDFLRSAPLFAWLAVANTLAWLVVGWRYWFRIPTTGLALSALCFLIAAVKLSL